MDVLAHDTSLVSLNNKIKVPARVLGRGGRVRADYELIFIALGVGVGCARNHGGSDRQAKYVVFRGEIEAEELSGRRKRKG